MLSQTRAESMHILYKWANQRQLSQLSTMCLLFSTDHYASKLVSSSSTAHMWLIVASNVFAEYLDSFLHFPGGIKDKHILTSNVADVHPCKCWKQKLAVDIWNNSSNEYLPLLLIFFEITTILEINHKLSLQKCNFDFITSSRLFLQRYFGILILN